MHAGLPEHLQQQLLRAAVVRRTDDHGVPGLQVRQEHRRVRRLPGRVQNRAHLEVEPEGLERCDLLLDLLRVRVPEPPVDVPGAALRHEQVARLVRVLEHERRRRVDRSDVRAVRLLRVLALDGYRIESLAHVSLKTNRSITY